MLVSNTVGIILHFVIILIYFLVRMSVIGMRMRWCKLNSQRRLWLMLEERKEMRKNINGVLEQNSGHLLQSVCVCVCVLASRK